MNKEYEAPSYRSDAFYCPFCDVYSLQTWETLLPKSIGMPTSTGGNGIVINSGAPLKNAEKYKPVKKVEISMCVKCKNKSVWIDSEMLYPPSCGPLPTLDMPEKVKMDFLEAREIANISPRAAAALLRLALQKLMIELGETGKDLFEDIGNLVAKGMPEKLQKAADSVRVIGNNAVHPGQIDLKDDISTAITLFHLLNMIVDVMITQPDKINDFYSKIPNSSKKAINERDGRKN